MVKSDLGDVRIETARTIVRPALPDDLAQIAAWPPYPFPHEDLSMPPTPASPGSPEPWWKQIDGADRLHFSAVLRETGDVIGVHAFVGIVWPRARVRNMGVRLRADLRGRGYGAETLAPLLQALLAKGFLSIRLDVWAFNAPAIHCYEKCGMRITSETWLEANVPTAINPDDPRWAFALPHLRRECGRLLLRYYYMEIGDSSK